MRKTHEKLTEKNWKAVKTPGTHEPHRTLTKSKLVFILLALCMLSCLSACKNKDKPAIDYELEESTEEEKTTLKNYSVDRSKLKDVDGLLDFPTVSKPQG